MKSSDSSEAGDDNPKSSAFAGHVPAVSLVVRQRRVKADWPEFRMFLDTLSSRLARSSFGVCITSDRGIRRYNKQFRNHDQSTDVLSFPSGEPLDAEPYLGDIVISAETALRNAATYGLSIEQEIKILALHGVLHLKGFDHETDRGQMARAEKMWAARLGLATSLTSRSGRRLSVMPHPQGHNTTI